MLRGGAKLYIRSADITGVGVKQLLMDRFSGSLVLNAASTEFFFFDFENFIQNTEKLPHKAENAVFLRFMAEVGAVFLQFVQIRAEEIANAAARGILMAAHRRLHGDGAVLRRG